MSRRVVCANCGESFISEAAEADVLAEAERNFGPLPEDEQPAIVCDTCYHMIMAWAHSTDQPMQWDRPR